MSALAYLLPPVTSLFVFATAGSRDRDTRFHALQATFLGVAFLALALLAFVLEGAFAASQGAAGSSTRVLRLVILALLILSFVGMVRTSRGTTWVVPVIGALAQREAYGEAGPVPPSPSRMESASLRMPTEPEAAAVERLLNLWKTATVLKIIAAILGGFALGGGTAVWQSPAWALAIPAIAIAGLFSAIGFNRMRSRWAQLRSTRTVSEFEGLVRPSAQPTFLEVVQAGHVILRMSHTRAQGIPRGVPVRIAYIGGMRVPLSLSGGLWIRANAIVVSVNGLPLGAAMPVRATAPIAMGAAQPAAWEVVG